MAMELSMVDEIQEYLANEQKNHPEYVQTLADVLAQLPPAVPGTSIFVLIPVHSSEQNIERLLTLYEKQTIKKQRYEVLLFLNRREEDSSVNRLKNQVREFQKSHTVRVCFFEWTFSQKAPIGLLRKILNDLALLRGSGLETLLVNNDADALKIDPEYLESLVALHRGKALLSTQSQHYIDAAYEIPYFGDLVRLVENLESAYGPDAPEDAFVSAWCGNTVLSAASYVRIGGFDPSAWVGEELVLTYFFVRKFGMQSFLRTHPYITTSCRRIAHGFLKNIRAVQAYSDFFTADIRNKSEEEILKSIRNAVQTGVAPSITKRAAEEFEFYLQKLTVTPPTPLTNTLESRFLLCREVFSRICKEIGMELRVQEDDTYWRLTFSDNRDSRQICIQK
ncbi:MAG: hypothetical protein AAB473_05275 [Patescibacteria group bacterium]